MEQENSLKTLITSPQTSILVKELESKLNESILEAEKYKSRSSFLSLTVKKSIDAKIKAETSLNVLQTKLSSMDTSSDKLKHLESQLQSAIKESESFALKYADELAHSSHFRQELSDLSSKYSDSLATSSNLTMEVNQLKTKLASLNSNASIQQESSSKYEQELNKMKEQLLEMNQKYEEASRDVSVVNEKYLKETVHSNNLREQLEELSHRATLLENSQKDQSEHEVNLLAEKYADELSTSSKLRHELESSDQKLSLLQASLDTAKNQGVELQKQLEIVQLQQKSLEEDIKKQKQLVTESQEACSSKQSDLNNAIKENSALLLQLKNLQPLYDSKLAELENLKVSHETIKSDHEKQVNQAKELEVSLLAYS